MRRISSAMNNIDTQSNLRLQESRLNKANNQISSQTRLQSLREDPIAAGHLVRYKSYLSRVNTFEKNAKELVKIYMKKIFKNTLDVIENILRSEREIKFDRSLREKRNEIKQTDPILNEIRLDVCKYRNDSNLFGALYNFKQKYKEA